MKVDEPTLSVVLIRPGQTQFDEEGRIQGTLDLPLSRCGADESAETAQSLRETGLEAVYCSPCASATETAARVAEALGVKFKSLDKLQNIDYGLWQGLLVDEVKRKQPRVYKQWLEHPETICPPQGETISAARERVATTLGKLLKKHKQGTIGLVCPEPLAALIRSHLMGITLSQVWQHDADGRSWQAIGVEPELLTSAI
ncbi:MAG: histidine phosphatase family protein [Planctomycetota bacterium]|nr:MAG: histidine phosphatase family protein [Planctomycetota bacterium]REJ92723.1 MAG: histidine phosphatase family protein [Planctomycetota bacterium]REK23761.1 MAG: histidine phosphatase family protein [Planctomycetota bacterium]REK47614.1 MAG: histidine phosphatase family protein [Planctomycetota bacterium]